MSSHTHTIDHALNKRSQETLGIKDDISTIILIILGGRKIVRDAFTLCYNGKITDLGKLKLFFLFTIERIRSNRENKETDDFLENLLTKNHFSYSMLQTIIEEEFKIAVEFYENLRSSI